MLDPVEEFKTCWSDKVNTQQRVRNKISAVDEPRLFMELLIECCLGAATLAMEAHLTRGELLSMMSAHWDEQTGNRRLGDARRKLGESGIITAGAHVLDQLDARKGGKGL